MLCKEKEKAWVEKYRPLTIEDCILPAHMKKIFLEIIKDGYIPNMLFHGSQGTGKTTVARALCEELGVDYIIINASDERGLDMLRTKVTDFASTVSLSGNGKCIILDESDHLLPATQAAFRNSLEALSANCSFIWTANYPSRIIPALHSRLANVDFKINEDELEQLQAQFFMRVCDILNNEHITYDETVLYHVIVRFFPDNRKIIQELQQYSKSGVIDEGILMAIKEIQLQDLIVSIKNRKFKEIRQWAADNSGNDLSSMYEKLYNELVPYITPDTIGFAIRVLDDYQRWDATVPSKELHVAALCVDLMLGVEFK